MKKCRVRSRECGVRRACGVGSGGFSIIELLIAMTIMLLLSGAIAGLAQPARAAFDRVPAELELHQRGRTAIDALSQALRAASPMPGEPGSFSELTILVPVPDAAQGVLSSNQAGPGAALTLGMEQCPNVKDVCGFIAGITTLITHPDGYYDVFSIASVSAGARSITPAGALSQSYPSGAAVSEIDHLTFRLAEQPDGSYSLIRETAAGAIQPIVDFVSELSFDVTGRVVDEVFFQSEQINVRMIVEPHSEALRSVIGARVFRTSIRLRNAS
jgi:prepilin-type N-terminal cleavage/methylation domain-containing protein